MKNPLADKIRPNKYLWEKNTYLLSLIIMIVLIIVNASLQRNFFQPYILSSNFRTFLPLVLVAMGQAFIILGGGIDLSLGFMVSMTNVSVVQLIGVWGDSTGVVLAAMLTGVAISSAAGFINGVLVSYFRLTPIITTFATGTVWGGIALWVMPTPGGSVPPFYYTTYSSFVLGIPFVLWIIAVILLIYGLVIKNTRFFRYLKAVGGSSTGAFETGLPVHKIKMLSYTMGGLFTGLATLCIIGETASGDPLLGEAYTLNSISAVVLGGTALAGGFGGVVGPIFGAIILGIMDNVIFFAQLPAIYQKLLQGLIIIVALAIGGITTKKGSSQE